jgi:hypothetical protein
MCSGSAGQVAPARGRPSPWIRLRNSFDLPPNASSWPSSRAAGKTRPYGPGWRSGGSVAPNCMMSRARRCVPTLHCGDTGSPPTVRPLSPAGPIWHEAPVRFQARGAKSRLPDARGEVLSSSRSGGFRLLARSKLLATRIRPCARRSIHSKMTDTAMQCVHRTKKP